MKLPNKKWNECRLLDVLYVPKLSYNLLSISKATELGNSTDFNEKGCQIYNAKGKLIAEGSKIGSLYYLNCSMGNVKVNVANRKTNENIWHRRFGHLRIQNLQRLARSKMVRGFDFNALKQIDFCEACVEGKHHRTQFPTSNSGRAKEPLALVHSDVCGKVNAKSLGGAEYFLTFIDDFSHSHGSMF